MSFLLRKIGKGQHTSEKGMLKKKNGSPVKLISDIWPLEL